MKRNKLLRKIEGVGYLKIPKRMFLLVKNKELTRDEFLLYLICLATFDFDSDHKYTAGILEATNRELAEIGGWKHDTSITDYKKRLLVKGYLIKDINSDIYPKDYKKFLWKKKADKNQKKPEINQDEKATYQNNSEINQPSQAQNTDYPLGSSKSNLSSSEVIDDKELDRIIEYFDTKSNESGAENFSKGSHWNKEVQEEKNQ